jgi:protein disulfide-isomerase A1
LLLEHHQGKVRIAKVDCTSESSVCSEYDVHGYPTLIFFDGQGAVFKYEGGRNQAAIEGYAKRMIGPATVKIAAETELKKLASSNGAVVLYAEGAAGVADDHEARKVFRAACDRVKDKLVCAETTSAALLERAGGAQIIVYKEGSYDPAPALEPFEEDTLRAYFLANRFAAVTEITPETYSELVNSGRKLVIAALDPYWKKREAWLGKIKSMATTTFKRTDDFFFGWIDGVKWHEFTKQFGAKVDDLPVLIVQDGPDGAYWIDLELDTTDKATMTVWLQGVAAGTVAAKRSGIWDTVTRFFQQNVPWLYEQPMLVGLAILALVAPVYFLIYYSSSEDAPAPNDAAAPAAPAAAAVAGAPADAENKKDQ